MRRVPPQLLAAAAAIALLGSPALAVGEPVRVLSPGQTIMDEDEPGRVLGVVRDRQTGEPVADMPLGLFVSPDVELRRWPEPWEAEYPEIEETPLATVTSAGDGRFRFDGVGEGRYQVRPTLDDVAPDLRTVVVSREKPRVEVEVGVALGAVVSGVVLDSAVPPSTDWYVFVAGLDLGDGLNARAGRSANPQARTGAGGEFRLIRVPEGLAYLQAGRSGRGFSEPLPVRIEAGATLRGVELRVPDEVAWFSAVDHAKGRAGFSLDFLPGGPTLSQVVPGMPADRAGLRPGDRIVAVDGRSTLFRTAVEFVQRCRGPVGGTVELTVERAGEGIFDTTLERAAFDPDQQE